MILSHSQSMTFAEVMRTIKPKLRKVGLPLIGVGVGMAGIINPDTGLIEQSTTLNIEHETRFYDEIVGLLEVPVMIENDANCCCWGELAFRKTERHGSFVFVLGEFRRGRTSGQDY